MGVDGDIVGVVVTLLVVGTPLDLFAVLVVVSVIGVAVVKMMLVLQYVAGVRLVVGFEWDILDTWTRVLSIHTSMSRKTMSQM